MVVGGVQRRSKRRGPLPRSTVQGKKVKVVRRQSDGSDDDFVSPPLAFLARLQEDPVWNAPDGVLTTEEENVFPKIKTRSPASILVDSLKDLSCLQKNDIRDMGFAALLDFNVEGFPTRLVHWLLYNFDGESRVFDLGGGRSLTLDERDVEFVLGFPRGPIEMVKRDKMEISNLLMHWRGKFEKKKHAVTAALVSTVMVSRVNGGLWFRRHFCMLVLSTLVSCMTNGYANQMYFHHFDDVARIRDLNWCKLVVDTLVETQAAWKSGKHKIFVGPAEFVALFYVDRVVHFARPIPRLVPAFRGWSLELLNQREFSEIRFGGFGQGVIELPDYDGVHGDGGGNPTQGNEDVGGSCSSPLPVHEYGPKTFAEVVDEKTADAVASIRQLLGLVKDATDGVFDREVCRQLREVIQLLVRLKQQPSCENPAGSQPPQSTFSQREDMFWSNEENIRAIEDVERAILERNDCFDVPSFSLGLTQDFNGGVREVADHNAPDAQGVVDASIGGGNLSVPADMFASPAAVGVESFAHVSTTEVELGGNAVVPEDATHFVGACSENIGVDGFSGPAATSASPSVGGTECLGHGSVPELAVDGNSVIEEEATPCVEPVEQLNVVYPCRSDGPLCASPLKAVRAARQPPNAVRGLGSLGEKFDGPSQLAVGSVPDLQEEAVVVNWLLGGGPADMEDILFSIGSRIARWDDLLTLVPGSDVGVAVIDAWSSLLNQRERVKDPGAPSRFLHLLILLCIQL